MQRWAPLWLVRVIGAGARADAGFIQDGGAHVEAQCGCGESEHRVVGDENYSEREQPQLPIFTDRVQQMMAHAAEAPFRSPPLQLALLPARRDDSLHDAARAATMQLATPSGSHTVSRTETPDTIQARSPATARAS